MCRRTCKLCGTTYIPPWKERAASARRAMFELGLGVCAAGVLLVAVALAHACIRSMWDAIAALGLFILAYSFAGDLVSHGAEALLAKIGFGPPVVTRRVAMITGAVAGVVALLLACGVAAATIRLLVGSVRRLSPP